MNVVSANDLKKKGVSVFAEHEESLITVRGEGKYIVLSIDDYEELREAALEAALLETREDLAKGRYVIEDVDSHMKRIGE